MSNNVNDQQVDFETVKNRLAEIADAVDDESLSLDEALGLYEEAVALGLQASDLLEVGIVVPEEPEGLETAQEAAQGAASGADNASSTPDQAADRA